ncbi:unnamed protein product [Adineta steineri]|uniref:AAA+ ATPase domain-containing protein n=2 Tax=Adineta steineri TaxID=433720 RepID=A0A820B4I6_9BILA|nr:unnamed protein product [Adineta steineri]
MDLHYYVIQPLISSIKTGNICHDCLLIILALFCLTFISKVSAYAMEILQHRMRAVSLRPLTASYTIDVVVNTLESEYTTFRMQVPEEYLGIVHHIHTSDINIRSARQIPSQSVKSTAHLDELVNYFITTKTDLIISPDIHLFVKQMQESSSSSSVGNSSSNKSSENYHYQITLFSRELTFKQLKAAISDWTMAYRNYMKHKNKGASYHFTFLPSTGSLLQNARVEFDKHHFSTSKSFDNLFYEGKQSLLQRLDFFLQNPQYYKQRGIAHSMGLMFYGEPGCGKTSTIKAIAAYTGRHLVEIPLSRIRSCDELKRAFYLNSYDTIDLNFSDKIIVFEDIDCMSNVIKRRSTTSSSSSSSSDSITSDTDDVTIRLQQEDLDKREKKLSKQYLRNLIGSDSYSIVQDPLTLSFLLNLIDGIIEQPSRILIMTTNHPDQIDPALIRPGRIDFKQEFKRCSKPIIKDMIEHFFAKECDIDVTQLHDYIYSPADVVSACMSATDGQSTVELLMEQQSRNINVKIEQKIVS